MASAMGGIGLNDVLDQLYDAAASGEVDAETLQKMLQDDEPKPERPLSAEMELELELEEMRRMLEEDCPQHEPPQPESQPVAVRPQKQPRQASRQAEPKRPVKKEENKRAAPQPAQRAPALAGLFAKLKKVRRNRLWLLAFLWFTFCYYEIVTRGFTIRTQFWKPGLILSLLFSIAPAMLLFLFATNLKPRGNRLLVILSSAVFSVFYMSQVVYYQIFSQFYSATSMGNAGQVAEFWKTTLEGIAHCWFPILLLCIPTAFLCILGRYFFSFKGKAGLKSTGAMAVLMLAVYLLSVWSLPLWGKKNGTPYDVYHYKTDVREAAVQMGLGTAFRRDLHWKLFGGGTRGLVLDPETPSTSADASNPPSQSQSDPSNAPSTTPATEPISYNVTNLDLDALIASESDEEIRDMHAYFSQQIPTAKNEKTGMFQGYNLILLTCEAFSHLAIDPELTPTLYKMQTEGFHFTNFYTPIWGVSTSDGEYVAMTGTLPEPGVWSFFRSSEKYMPMTMVAQLKELGYSAYAYHNHNYGFYDRDLSHPNLGYDYKAVGNGLEDLITEQWPESDLEMIDVTTAEYMGKEPFHAYYMTVSGHLQYNFEGGNAMATKNQALVQDLPYSDAVKAYLACQIELDRAMNLLLQRLEEAGVADRTVIVLSADHYPYGLTDEEIGELQGHPLETNFEKYRNACIIYKKGMTPETVDWPCSSLDLLPTLCNLFGLEYDSRFYVGHDVFSDAKPLIIFQNRSWITDQARYNAETGAVESLTGAEVSDEYVDRIDSMVSNKFAISTKILENDYWAKLFQKE